MSFDKISGMLVYVQLQESVKAYSKPPAPPKPNEWKASVVITDEDLLDELEEYAKTLETMISVKKVKTAEFEEKYHVAPPADAGKNVWILTLRKSVELGKTGKPVPDLYRPKVFQKMGSKIVDITQSKLVGNGSIGTISIDKFDRTSGGSSLYLKNVLVTELVEYTKPEGSNYESGSEFEEGESDDQKTESKVAEKPKATAAKKATKASDEDAPF